MGGGLRWGGYKAYPKELKYNTMVWVPLLTDGMARLDAYTDDKPSYLHVSYKKSTITMLNTLPHWSIFTCIIISLVQCD